VALSAFGFILTRTTNLFHFYNDKYWSFLNQQEKNNNLEVASVRIIFLIPVKSTDRNINQSFILLYAIFVRSLHKHENHWPDLIPGVQDYLHSDYLDQKTD